MTYTRILDPTGKDVHRNSPCPCGSNKKYKKCCRVLFYFVCYIHEDFEPGETLFWKQQGAMFPYADRKTGYIRKFSTSTDAAAWAEEQLGPNGYEIYSVKAREAEIFTRDLEQGSEITEFD